MKFDNFKIEAYPKIIQGRCAKCGHDLVEIPNGWFSVAMFCPKCESVYALKLVKVPDKRVAAGFIEKTKETIKRGGQ